jgi:hypothetical protein
MIRRKKRKHSLREGKPLLGRTSANQEWALDFVHDAVECGRTIRVLSVVDGDSLRQRAGADEPQGTQTPSLAPRAPPSRPKPAMEQQKLVVFLRERKPRAGQYESELRRAWQI